MAATQDPALLNETTKFITHKARDQDITYFFGALEGNFKARRKLTKYLQDEYDVVSSTVISMYTRGF